MMVKQEKEQKSCTAPIFETVKKMHISNTNTKANTNRYVEREREREGVNNNITKIRNCYYYLQVCQQIR